MLTTKGEKTIVPQSDQAGLVFLAVSNERERHYYRTNLVDVPDCSNAGMKSNGAEGIHLDQLLPSSALDD